MKNAVSKGRVIICEDHVVKDPKEIQKILDRVSEIVSASYRRRMEEGESA